jgi:uncharacterized membrane protein YphA (DoxX/SURF4 family)
MNLFSRWLLVLLRMAIGWHIGYEGLCKLDPRWAEIGMPRTSGAPKSFTAEYYLRNASGPLRNYFRSLVPDFDGEEKLAAERNDRAWRAALTRAEEHYGFSAEQKTALRVDLERIIGEMKAWLDQDDTKKKVEDYRGKRAKLEAREKELFGRRYVSDPDPLARQVDDKLKGDVEAARRELTGRVEGWVKEFDGKILERLDGRQLGMNSPEKAWHELSELEKVNLTTRWGLTICGIGMFLGLFSRLSSLGAAGFLTLFYVAYLVPGYFPVPNAEGSYLVINKNVVELIACLALATMPTGCWGGLDALIRGLFTRPVFGVGVSELYKQTDF